MLSVSSYNYSKGKQRLVENERILDDLRLFGSIYDGIFQYSDLIRLQHYSLKTGHDHNS